MISDMWNLSFESIDVKKKFFLTVRKARKCLTLSYEHFPSCCRHQSNKPSLSLLAPKEKFAQTGPNIFLDFEKQILSFR